MEMIPFLFIPLYTVMPLVSGAAAKSYGRSFWNWVLIGVLLPGPSLLLLYWLTGKDEAREKQQPLT